VLRLRVHHVSTGAGPLDDNTVAFVDWLHRRRLATLQSVDDGFGRLMQAR